MRIERLGSGEPSVVVIGGIHGDEPCGVRAVDHLLSTEFDFQGSVTAVLANERAVERGVRYVETDLNRAFPPHGTHPDDHDYPDSHEGRLAERLYDLVREEFTLALHSTQSHPDPFAAVVDPDDRQLDVCARLPLGAIVDSAALAEGRLVETTDTVEVEAGYQGSAAATANAVEAVEAFLRATGVLPDPADPVPKPLYRLVDRIEKPISGDYEVFVDNFQRVEAGETFAAVDGEPMVADAPFYPVLFSAYGYENQFGYAAELADEVPSGSGPTPDADPDGGDADARD